MDQVCIPWSLPCSDWLERLLGPGWKLVSGQWRGEVEVAKLEAEHLSSLALLPTEPVDFPVLGWSAGGSRESREGEEETTKGCLVWQAEFVFFMCGPDDLMELEKIPDGYLDCTKNINCVVFSPYKMLREKKDYNAGALYLTTALCWSGLCTAGVSWLLSDPIKPLSVSGDTTPS